MWLCLALGVLAAGSGEQRNSPYPFQPKERWVWPALGGSIELSFCTCSGWVFHFLRVAGFEANRWVWEKIPLKCDQISWNNRFFFLLFGFQNCHFLIWVIVQPQLGLCLSFDCPVALSVLMIVALWRCEPSWKFHLQKPGVRLVCCMQRPFTGPRHCSHWFCFVMIEAWLCFQGPLPMCLYS